MKRGCIIFSVMFLLMVSMVLAIDTKITIKTKADRDIVISVLGDNDNLIKEFKNETDSDGKYVVELSTSELLVDIVVIVRKNGKFEYGGPQRYDNQKTANPIVIDLEQVIVEKVVENTTEEVGEIIEPVDEIVKNTTEMAVDATVSVVDSAPEVPEETNVIEEKEPRKITGMIVEGGKSIINSKITYYIIGGLFIIGILFFLIFTARKKLDKKKLFKKDFSKNMNDLSIEDAEKKLDEAKKELDEIKNRKRKLAEAREKFKRDQEELRKLESDG